MMGNIALWGLINTDNLLALVGVLHMKLNHPENEVAPNAPGLYLLSKAVSVGALRIANFLINNGADMNLVNGDAGTLIDKAIEYGHREMVGLLYAKGAPFSEANFAFVEAGRRAANAATMAALAGGAGAGGAGAVAPMPSQADLEAVEALEATGLPPGTKVIVWTCPICLLAKQHKTMLGCGHVFCTQCSAMLHDDRCPICIAPIISKQRVYIGGKRSNTKRKNRKNLKNRNNHFTR